MPEHVTLGSGFPEPRVTEVCLHHLSLIGSDFNWIRNENRNSEKRQKFSFLHIRIKTVFELVTKKKTEVIVFS